MAAEDIAELAAHLRAHKALGRSNGLSRLFDYLAETSIAENRPKEFEVAAAVFGRDSGFDGAQDASVRVAVHRLRRKLDDYYAGPGRDDPMRLSIPKGEYRMTAEPRPAEAAAPARDWKRLAVAGVAALVALNIVAWAAFWATHGPDRALERVRHSAPWAQLVRGDTPTLLVVGDYYIFGEIDEHAGIDRLVREYSINSREDLDAWLMDNPKAMGSYRDLDLYYLPVGAAFALRSLTPVLSRGAGRPPNLHVVLASDLTPEMLKHNNIVYIGYLSGLGLLRDPVFAGSRFSVGDTYDELYDTKTGRQFASQEGGPSTGDASHRDYGYVTAFRGPDGNRIVVVAGARDTGLAQMAEALTDRATLDAIARGAGGGESFEALYEAEGMGRSSLSGHLVSASPRTSANPWTAHTALHFPAG